MFTHYRTKGFVIKKEDRGEANRVFTFYTKDFGKVNLVAKAERKIVSKLRGGLELFYLSEIEFIQGKNQKTLIDVVAINIFKNTRQDLAKLSVAQKISETVDELIKGQEYDEKIWELLINVFNELEFCDPKTNSHNLKIIYYNFLKALVFVLGYGHNESLARIK